MNQVTKLEDELSGMRYVKDALTEDCNQLTAENAKLKSELQAIAPFVEHTWAGELCPRQSFMQAVIQMREALQ